MPIPFDWSHHQRCKRGPTGLFSSIEVKMIFITVKINLCLCFNRRKIRKLILEKVFLVNCGRRRPHNPPGNIYIIHMWVYTPISNVAKILQIEKTFLLKKLPLNNRRGMPKNLKAQHSLQPQESCSLSISIYGSFTA